MRTSVLLKMLAGAVLSAMLLVVLVEILRFLPLPEVTNLQTEFWQVRAPMDGNWLAQRAGYYVFVVQHVWLLWLMVLGCVALTWAWIMMPGGQQYQPYLERIHALEQLLTEWRQRGEDVSGQWQVVNEKLDELFAQSADMWLVVDAKNLVRRWNAAALTLARRHNAGLESLEGRNLQEVLVGLANTELPQVVSQTITQNKVFNGEIQAVQLQQWLLVWAFPLGDQCALVLRDVTHRYRDNAFLQSTELLVRQLVENSVRPVAVLGPDWRYVFVSRKWPEVLGLPADMALLGQDHRVVVPDFPANFAVVAQQVGQLPPGGAVGREDERFVRHGREHVLSWHVRPWLDAHGRPAGYIFTVVDQTELVRLRQQVAQAEERENTLAYSDALTGLPNRQLFHDRLNQALAQAYRQLGKVALMFLDLDGFKQVNDQLGHDSGDLLLKQVAERLKTCVRQTDTVARLGGDEFTIVLSIRDRNDAVQVAEKVLRVLSQPYDLNGKVADQVGTSIGIALYPADGSQAADLMKKADAAMYAAKQAGKRTYRFATVEMPKAPESAPAKLG